MPIYIEPNMLKVVYLLLSKVIFMAIMLTPLRTLVNTALLETCNKIIGWNSFFIVIAYLNGNNMYIARTIKYCQNINIGYASDSYSTFHSLGKTQGK